MSPQNVQAEQPSESDDVMSLLVELRTAAKRGNESSAAQKLGPEFSKYLADFYELSSEHQSPVLEAFLQSRRLEQSGDSAGLH